MSDPFMHEECRLYQYILTDIESETSSTSPSRASTLSEISPTPSRASTLILPCLPPRVADSRSLRPELKNDFYNRTAPLENLSPSDGISNTNQATRTGGWWLGPRNQS